MNWRYQSKRKSVITLPVSVIIWLPILLVYLCELQCFSLKLKSQNVVRIQILFPDWRSSCLLHENASWPYFILQAANFPWIFTPPETKRVSLPVLGNFKVTFYQRKLGEISEQNRWVSLITVYQVSIWSPRFTDHFLQRFNKTINVWNSLNVNFMV